MLQTIQRTAAHTVDEMVDLVCVKETMKCFFVHAMCVDFNFELRMDPRFSALPFTDIRALMSHRDSQTVALFVHRCCNSTRHSVLP
jgi:hypothetical protein